MDQDIFFVSVQNGYVFIAKYHISVFGIGGKSYPETYYHIGLFKFTLERDQLFKKNIFLGLYPKSDTRYLDIRIYKNIFSDGNIVRKDHTQRHEL